jgi:hypothetical protein
MAKLTFTKASAERLSIYLPVGAVTSANIGSLGTRATWRGAPVTVEIMKNGFPRRTSALDTGETFAIEGWPLAEADVTIHQSNGQSNGVGDAPVATFETWVNAYGLANYGMSLAQTKALIFPSTWIGGNNSGTDIIGPAQVMAALFAMHTKKPQCLVDTAQVTNSILDLWGTNGEDGNYRTRRDHSTSFQGGVGANPAGLASRAIRRFNWYAQGEADTALLTNPTQPTHFRPRTLDLLNKIASDFPLSPVIAHHVFVLGTTFWQAEANQPWLGYVGDELLSLANLAGTETNGVPVLTTRYNTPGDWQAGDAPHVDAPANGLAGWTRMGPIIFADYLQRGLV